MQGGKGKTLGRGKRSWGKWGDRSVRPTAGGTRPRRELVPCGSRGPGSIPERVQYANMDDWRMGCPWWIVLLYNPVSGPQRFLCHAIMSIAMVQKGLEPNGCGRSTLVKNRHKNRHKFLLLDGTTYEISLASWPLAVALIYAVAMCILLVTDNGYILSIEILDSSCFLRG